MPWFSVNQDGSEQLQYTMEGVPVRACDSWLTRETGYAAACHWHDDFEMLTVPEGEIDYFINGHTVHLRQGDGIFVNARRLHYGFSAKERDCRYRFVVFHPRLLGETPALTRVIQDFSADDRPDYLLFESASPAMLLFNELYAAASSASPLLTLAKAAEMLDLLRQQGEHRGQEMPQMEWMLLRKMTGFIQSHFEERITLEQIAMAGAVCRSRCCALFRDHLGSTPMEYVTRYRLDKACEMLRQGHSVTETALSCGFNGSSYFAETFRKVFGKTPREYQRSAQQ